jgi:hypothetical protein
MRMWTAKMGGVGCVVTLDESVRPGDPFHGQYAASVKVIGSRTARVQLLGRYPSLEAAQAACEQWRLQ